MDRLRYGLGFGFTAIMICRLMLSCGIIGNGLQSSTVAVDRGSTLGHGDSAARISKRSVMKKRTLISTTAGLAVAAMLMGAGFVATANAAEIDNNNITITQPGEVKGQLIPPTVDNRQFKAYRISDYSNAQVNDKGQITGYDMKVTNGSTDDLIRDARVENTKNINDFAKTGGAIMTMLALAGALALWMSVFCFFSMS